MSHENTTTLDSYNHRIEEFIERTPKTMIGETKTWIDAFMSQVSPSASLLELGSGFGRDADYMNDFGYTVTCTDGAEGFVKHLRSQGRNAYVLDVLNDDLGGPWNAVFSNAMFEHLPRPELASLMQRISDSLLTGGVLAFSIRQGSGEGWTEEKIEAPRYFWYWEEQDIRDALAAAGLRPVHFESAEGYNSIKRLYVIASKGG